MSEESQRIHLTDRMKQVQTGMPMAFPNAKFDRPKDKPYGEFHILGGDSFTVGMNSNGTKRERYTCMLQMTIWIPEGQGLGHATRAADAFKKRFANKQGFDGEDAFYRFKTMNSITPTKSAQNWSACVYRIAFTRDQDEDVEAALAL